MACLAKRFGVRGIFLTDDFPGDTYRPVPGLFSWGFAVALY